MSGGTLIVWLRVCNASIGVPAAMRPITGTATGRSPSSAGRLELARTLPRLPSMTLGVKPRRLPAAAWSSGSLMTSIARARVGRRRMKPRSSSAVIRRWMPDFERRSSASFISSKEGGTPLSLRRSLMNRRSSYCLRVNISTKVPRLMSSDSETQSSAISRYMLETNHERTLYVRYMFRNCLIYREQSKVRGTRIAGRSDGEPQHFASRAGFGLRRERCAHEKYLCCSEIRKQRRVLMIDGKNDARAIVTLLQMRAQIVLALVVGADVAAEHGAFTAMVNHRTARQGANQRHHEQESAHVGRHGIARQADHTHCAEPPVHHRLAWAHRDLPERHRDAFVPQRLLDQVVVADRCASGRDQDVGAALTGAADAGGGGLERVGGNTEVDGLGALAAGERVQGVAVGIDDLAVAGHGARHHQLVAGGENRDFRTPENAKVRMVHPGGEREVALGETTSLAQEHVALAEIDACGADVPSGDRGFLDRDARAGGDRVLLDHDGVRAKGNDAAGED